MCLRVRRQFRDTIVPFLLMSASKSDCLCISHSPGLLVFRHVYIYPSQLPHDKSVADIHFLWPESVALLSHSSYTCYMQCHFSISSLWNVVGSPKWNASIPTSDLPHSLDYICLFPCGAQGVEIYPSSPTCDACHSFKTHRRCQRQYPPQCSLFPNMAQNHSHDFGGSTLFAFYSVSSTDFCYASSSLNPNR